MLRTRLTAVAATALGILLLAPGTSTAGGPTSVIIVSPQNERTASMYTSDDDYDALQEALGRDPVPTPDAPEGLSTGPGADVTITWLIHDAHVWRIDRVTVDAGGESWIHTQRSADGSLGSSDGVWHRPADSDELVGILDRLGVLDRAAAASPAPAGAGVAAQGSAGTDVGFGTWTVPALVGGVVVGFLGDRLWRRRGERSGGGRWELVDESST